MRPARYRAALEQLRLSPTAAARLLGVSGATSRRWAAQGTCRGPAEILLRLVLSGRITSFDAQNARNERGCDILRVASPTATRLREG